ncbi:MAG TPA: S-methyl-5-thioribose-1-phosphate isomerase [Bacteroidota bacterium]|nr:S-methyl-5-thioribose-1-phosphate isomerase [Bacteroidota bacterium]
MTTLEWADGTLRFIDQTRLPAEEVIVETADDRVVCEAIRSLKIRGAPAIGVAAAFAVLLAVRRAGCRTRGELLDAVDQSVRELSATRPTAVNLFAAMARMQGAAHASGDLSVEHTLERLKAEALAIEREDIASCASIGRLGASLIAPGSSLLTHCNAGALATAGEGTALAVVREAARQGNVVRVFVDETRPLLQGSRLTAWELVRSGIETVLITDSTAASVLRRGDVQAVIVGADRIAANGDTANKVGTYPLAVLASRHGVPFYVAAPTSTIDPSLGDGSGIPIEERDPVEVTHVGGIRVAASGVSVFAPAFDVTPASLVSAIITERGVLRAPYGKTIGAAMRAPGGRTKGAPG